MEVLDIETDIIKANGNNDSADHYSISLVKDEPSQAFCGVPLSTGFVHFATDHGGDADECEVIAGEEEAESDTDQGESDSIEDEFLNSMIQFLRTTGSKNASLANALSENQRTLKHEVTTLNTVSSMENTEEVDNDVYEFIVDDS